MNSTVAMITREFQVKNCERCESSSGACAAPGRASSNSRHCERIKIRSGCARSSSESARSMRESKTSKRKACVWLLRFMEFCIIEALIPSVLNIKLYKKQRCGERGTRVAFDTSTWHRRVILLAHVEAKHHIYPPETFLNKLQRSGSCDS